MKNINDCLIIGYDISEEDESILTVGHLIIEEPDNKTLTINKVFRGKAAMDLYTTLTTKN